MPRIIAILKDQRRRIAGLGLVGALCAGLGGMAQASETEAAPRDAPPAQETAKRVPSELSRQVPGRLRLPDALQYLFADQQRGQIRIEKRVILRITPQRGPNRSTLLAQLPQRALNTRYVERKTDKCLAVDRIAGVQTGSGSRLLLFLRDADIMSVNLEKACRARDFYSGFYIERNEDGKICVDRDQLRSRNGARCEIERMSQLVAVED